MYICGKLNSSTRQRRSSTSAQWSDCGQQWKKNKREVLLWNENSFQWLNNRRLCSREQELVQRQSEGHSQKDISPDSVHLDFIFSTVDLKKEIHKTGLLL